MIIAGIITGILTIFVLELTNIIDSARAKRKEKECSERENQNPSGIETDDQTLIKSQFVPGEDYELTIKYKLKYKGDATWEIEG